VEIVRANRTEVEVSLDRAYRSVATESQDDADDYGEADDD
jgi:hypothetical protein